MGMASTPKLLVNFCTKTCMAVQDLNTRYAAIMPVPRKAMPNVSEKAMTAHPPLSSRSPREENMILKGVRGKGGNRHLSASFKDVAVTDAAVV